jgi:hypothetical protein
MAAANPLAYQDTGTIMAEKVYSTGPKFDNKHSLHNCFMKVGCVIQYATLFLEL